jgi:hypothetical protein
MVNILFYFYIVSDILNKALSNKTISEEQTKYVLDMLENPYILKEINFIPEDLMKLIDKNSTLATEIMLKISKSQIFQE